MERMEERPLVYALVGNPNCGKSTLFNALTGLRQRVGNYPGVTVEKKVGECFSQHGRRMVVIDLPGSYSLNARSPDESVLRDVLLGRAAGTPRPDRVVCVVDASNLERHLYLVTQIAELGLPVILALNMIDLAEADAALFDEPPRPAGRLGQAERGEQPGEIDPSVGDQVARDRLVADLIGKLSILVHAVERGLRRRPGALAVVQVDDLARHAPLLLPGVERAVLEALLDAF